MNADELSPLSRRALLLGFAATGLSSTAGALEVTTTPARARTPSPLVIHRKLRFRSDAGLVFWWLHGVKYGQVGSELRPLYTNNIGTVMRVEPSPDGGFAVTSLETNIPTAVGGDEPMRTWRNPYTGESLEMRMRPVGPTRVRYNADGSRVFPTELGGSRLETESDSPAPTIVDDDVFISEWVRARVYREGRSLPFEVNDMSHYHGSFDEISDPTVTNARARVSFAEVTSWQSWMEMGDRPGGLTSRMFGSKADGFERMPARWRKGLAEIMPDLAEQLSLDPQAALDRAPAAFER